MAGSPQLVMAYQEQMNRREEAALAVIAAIWRSQGSWREENVEQALRQIVPYVYASQRSSVALTNAYMTRMGVAPATEAPALEYIVDNLRGVPATEVYQRPYKELWRGLSEGKDMGTALEASTRRLLTQAQTDMQMAARQAAHDRMEGDRTVIGYRRVPAAGCCSLCAVASTQRYHKADLMPIHAWCRCKVAPAFEDDSDPGNVVNKARLAQLRESGAYQEVKLRREASRMRDRGNVEGAAKLEEQLKAHREKFGSTRNPELADVNRWRGDTGYVRQHGEYGPTLTSVDHDFTGPGDI